MTAVVDRLLEQRDALTAENATLRERVRVLERESSEWRASCRASLEDALGIIAARDSLRGKVERLRGLHRTNLATMEVQAMRLRAMGTSTDELMLAINETRAALHAEGESDGR